MNELRNRKETVGVKNIFVVDKMTPYSGMRTFAEEVTRNLGIELIKLPSEHYFLSMFIPRFNFDHRVIIRNDNFITYYGRNVITRIHDIFPLTYPDARMQKQLFILSMVFNRPRNVSFNSYYTQREYSRLYRTDHSTVIYPFLHPSFKPANADRSDFILMDIAHNKRKNIEYHEKAIIDNPNEHFIKIGGHFSREYPNVEYRDKISTEEVAHLYNKAKEVWWFSKDEGFGHPQAQAMMTKTPIRLLDTEINREIYGDVNNHDVDEKYNRIKKMCDPKRLRKQWFDFIDEVYA